MSSKNTKAKTVEKNQTAKEVVETKTQVSAPVQAQPVVETKQTQKNNKKSSKTAEPVVEAQVPAPTPAPIQAQPVVETKQAQKGGKKSSKQAEPVQAQVQAQAQTPAPVQAQPVVETKQSQKGGKKASKQAEPVAEVKAPTPTPVIAPVQAQPVVETKQSQKGSKKSSKQVEQVVEVKAQALPEPKVEVEAAEEADGDEQVGGKLRYFKLFYNDEYQGRYCGKKPKQAANKAFSSIIKEMKKNGNQKGGFNSDVNFSIRECTRNSKHKEYNYVGVREELKKPVDVEIKNEDGTVKKITYSFHNKIAKAPKNQEA